MKTSLRIGIVSISTLLTITAGAYALNDNTSAKIDSLLKRLDTETQKEIAQGESVQTPKGEFLSGASAEKTAALHDETLQQIDALTSRSEQEREGAIETIRHFHNDQTLQPTYQFSTPSVYSADTTSEIYYVGIDQYEINAANNQLIQFGPRPLTADDPEPEKYALNPAKTTTALQSMAETLIKQQTTADLSTLTLETNAKEKSIYFFRWTDKNNMMESGEHPFIQIGISRGGDIVSYTNTLDL